MSSSSTRSSVRPQLSVSVIAILTALFIILFDNQLFWRSLADRLALDSFSHWFFVLVVGMILLCLFTVLFHLFAFRPIFKPFLMLMLLSAATVSYFMDSFGVIVDKAMIHNVFETNVNEASELLTWPLSRHLLLYGGLPVLFLLITRVKRQAWRRELLTRSCVVLGCLVLAFGLVFLEYKNFALFGRQNRELREFINPVYAVYSLNRVVQKKYFANADEPIRPTAQDAVRDAAGPRSVVVLAVGETARAQSFSMNGYERNTNPYLGRRQVLDFSNVQACGTSTSESVPCMFSLLQHDNFKREKALGSENLLDVLQRTGVEVVWRDNDSGSKGVSDRVTYQDFNRVEDDGLCAAGNCFDEILLKGLDELMNSREGDMLIVLHLKGSHGPSYYKRVPPAFKVFTPECAADNIQDCSRQEIINAYDNTIVYTDYVLSELIGILKRQPFATSMLYVSDHGESLGENGVYLHGLPFSFAPPEQTQVPMVFWASEQFAREKQLDLSDLATRVDNAYSHDNLFHSVLGLFNVRTEAYRPELDLFSASRSS
jgi:lipid A ethanolaminephosphotransferase